MTKKIQSCNRMLAIAFLVAFLLTMVFVAWASNHHCHHEHCQICQQVQVTQKMLKGSAVAGVIGMVTVAMLLVVLDLCQYIGLITGKTTLFSLKVKLLN